MAKKRRHHRNPRRSRRAAVAVSNPRKRHHRNSRRSRRGFRLFNPGPNVTPALEGLAASMLAGGAGYVLSKGLGIAFDTYLPDSVPYKSLIGTGVAAGVAAFSAEKFLKGRPKVAAGVTVGAMIPVVEEILAMTPVGPMIGLYPADAGGASGGAMLPAPGGIQAALAGRLNAALACADDDDDGGSGWASTMS